MPTLSPLARLANVETRIRLLRTVPEGKRSEEDASRLAELEEEAERLRHAVGEQRTLPLRADTDG